MPKVKYDVSNVDESGGFEHVQPGMYIGKVAEINLKDSKSGNGPMFEVILQPVKTADGKAVKVKDKKKQVGRVYTYVLLEHEPSDWKLKEFTKAFGLKEKGVIDTDKLIGKLVQMNLKPDTDLEDRYRPRVGKLMALPAGRNGSSAAAAVEPDEDEDEEAVNEDAYTAEDLDAMEDDELIEAAAEFDITAPKGRMTPVKKKKLIQTILDAQAEQEDEDEEDDSEEDEDADEDVTAEEDEDNDEEDDDEEEDDEEDDDTEDEEDLEDTLGALDRSGLKAYIKEHELDITVKKSMEDEDIREAITEAVGGDTEEDEAVDYNSWSIDALKKETQERGLSTKGSKKILAGRLSKDDEDDDNPF
jgi:hypothetical protein